MSNIKPFIRPTGPSPVTKKPGRVVVDSHPSSLSITIHGYTTYVASLARLFDMNVGTLRGRLNAGWPYDAALIAEPQSHWNASTAPFLQDQEWVVEAVRNRLIEAYGEIYDQS